VDPLQQTIEISIIIPVFNEEHIIPELYSRLTNSTKEISANYELLFVNDGSNDHSLTVLKQFAEKDHHIKFISFSRNFGHQIAVSAGLDYSSGQYVVIIDADLQDPPELIPELFKKMKEGYQVVYAKRKSRKGESFLKKSTAKLFYRLLNNITSISIPLDTGDFRIVDRKIIEVLKRMPEQEKFLRGQIAWAGFKQTFIEYDRDERLTGKTGYTYKKMIRLAIDGITAFSNFPLKFASFVGLFVAGIAFILILYSLYGQFILKTNLPGWTSLMLSVLFIGGIQLLCIGVIGEYIGRISSNIRNRPLYIVGEANFQKHITRE
jgi:polyisoprenyl-phosphate glycosyltransferase